MFPCLFLADCIECERLPVAIMKPERPRPEEIQFFQTYAGELKESFYNEGLLKELIPYPHFVVWRYKLVDGHFKKPPFNPKSYYPAGVDNPNTWGTLDQALRALASGNFHGIGFVFSKEDPFTGIDLDDCVTNNGYIYSWAKKIIDTLNTYTEYSPGKGIRLFVDASLPASGRKIGNIEMYSEKHYMTITTRHVPDTATAIEKRSKELAAFYHQLVPPPRTQENTRGGEATPLWTPQGAQPDLSLPEKPDDQVIIEAFKDQHSNFSRYWNGDPSLWTPPAPGGKAERKSKSEAFFTLLLMLLTRTNDNQEQVTRLYRRSPFAANYSKADWFIGHDPDTGRPVTYLESSIRKAIEMRRNPPQRR